MHFRSVTCRISSCPSCAGESRHRCRSRCSARRNPESLPYLLVVHELEVHDVMLPFEESVEQADYNILVPVVPKVSLEATIHQQCGVTGINLGLCIFHLVLRKMRILIRVPERQTFMFQIRPSDAPGWRFKTCPAGRFQRISEQFSGSAQSKAFLPARNG